MWLRTMDGGLLNLAGAVSVIVQEVEIEPKRRVVESVEKSREIPARMAWDVRVGLPEGREVLLASYGDAEAEKKALALFEGIAMLVGAESLEGLQATGGALTSVSEPGRVSPLEETVLKGPREQPAAPKGA